MKLGMKSVSIKNFKEEYVEEYNFINDLLNRANLPFTEPETSDCDEPVEKSPKDKASHANRAQSLEELHRRLVALKEQKTTYRSLKIKRGLQSKLKRKKRTQEKKTKRNELSKTGEVSTREIQREEKPPTMKAPKPVFNSNSNLVFSKMDFLGETLTVADKESIASEKGSKKRILEKLQKSQNYLKNLEERGDTEKANEMKDELKWMNALKRSEGVKVKDDPQLLKKSLSKKESKKKVSKKKWNDRLNTVENQKVEKQKKRKENIEKKLQEKKQKKLKKATKKGRYVPTS